MHHPRIVSVLLRRHGAVALAATIVLVTGSPVLERKRRIEDGEVEFVENLLAILCMEELRVGERVADPDVGRRMAVDDHVHVAEAGGRLVFFLSVYVHPAAGVVGATYEQRAGAAGRVIDAPTLVTGRDIAYPKDSGYRAGWFRGSVELTFGFSACDGKPLHEVFINIPKYVVAGSLVLPEVKLGAAEDVDELRELLDHLLALADLGIVVEMDVLEHTAQLRVRSGKRGKGDVDLLADVLFVAKILEVVEAAPLWQYDGGVLASLELVRDVLHEHERKNIILVLAWVHAASKLIAELVQRRIHVVLLDGHLLFSLPFRVHHFTFLTSVSNAISSKTLARLPLAAASSVLRERTFCTRSRHFRPISRCLSSGRFGIGSDSRSR